MANLFGAIGLQDSDRLFNATVGQQVIYDESQKLLDRYNMDVRASSQIFIAGTTTNYKERFKLPGGGMLQRRGRNTNPGGVKASGSWDVAYPLIDFGDALVRDDVSMAYMTAAEYSLHLQNVFIRDANTYRYEMLRSLLNSSGYIFSDEIWGDLAVVPLANGDSVVYPPVIGSTSEATENLYLGSNYASSAISDTNNPVKTIAQKLQSHFGTPTGGSSIAVFYNSAEHDKVAALADFVKVQYQYVEPGVNTATVKIPGIPDVLLQGSWEVTGTCSGAVLNKWDHIPAGYMIGVHLEATPPLIERVDPADTGLGTGLQLVAKDMDSPFLSAYWRHRFGLAARNRLNGVAMQLVASTSYTTPTSFA